MAMEALSDLTGWVRREGVGHSNLRTEIDDVAAGRVLVIAAIVAGEAIIDRWKRVITGVDMLRSAL
jgi:hypothetical protein